MNHKRKKTRRGWAFKNRQRQGLFRSRALRRRITKAESVLKKELESRGIAFKFQPYYHDDLVLVIPDFVIQCKYGKLVVEVDGKNHERQKSYDQARTNWLKSERGLRVIRFTNKEVLKDLVHVMSAIDAQQPRLKKDIETIRTMSMAWCTTTCADTDILEFI